MKKWIVILYLAVSSCISNNELAKTNIEVIHFGGGGGFIGKISTYTLTAKGHILHEGKILNRISKQEVLEYFKLAQELSTYQFKDPNNLYCFLEIKASNKSNRIVWNLGSKGLNEKVINLYKKLISETNLNL